MSTNGNRRIGRTALITGGTSGIGLATATAMARSGYRVHLGSRSDAAVTSTVGSLREEGLDVDGSVVDVRSDESVRAFVETANERHGQVDVLVNNAGIGGGGPTAQLPAATWHNVIDTNLNSVFRMTQAVLTIGGMSKRSWGRVINIASTAGKQGVVMAAPYSASKHGVVGFTKSLGNELAATGITVNAVCPGYVETPMAVQVRRNYAALWNTTEEAILEKFEAKIPLGRYTTPEEVAGLVCYLASDVAASITAQAINVCGGLGNF
ncbi:MAG: 3-oxoacyl-ACP reductase FabG [Dermatophilaceae bacterium]